VVHLARAFLKRPGLGRVKTVRCHNNPINSERVNCSSRRTVEKRAFKLLGERRRGSSLTDDFDQQFRDMHHIGNRN